MTLTAAQIKAFQPGGQYYQDLVKTYGQQGANDIATAAQTGDPTQVTNAIVQAKYGAPLNTSTTDQLTNQLTTNPLAAPLQSANAVIGNTFWSFLKQPFVVLVVVLAGVGAMFWLFGTGWLPKWKKA